MRTNTPSKYGWTFRGRPRGRLRSHADTKLLEYLTEISARHGIESSEFFRKFVEAWNNQESTCKTLTIECRRKTRDSAVFLVTANYEAVAQFPIPERLLREVDPLKEFGYVLEHVQRLMEKRNVKPHADTLQIRDLKAGMKQINLKARVVKISEPKLVLTRFNDYVMFVNVFLSDDTGTIKLTLWNGKVKLVSLGDIVQVENAEAVPFRGELQLRIGKGGRVNILGRNRDQPAMVELQPY